MENVTRVTRANSIPVQERDMRIASLMLEAWASKSDTLEINVGDLREIIRLANKYKASQKPQPKMLNWEFENE